MLNKVIISIGITSLVSTLAGLLFISKFWIIFSLIFILQILFFYFFNSIYENKLIEKAQKLKLEEFKELNKNVVIVECPCDQKSKQEVDLRYDRDVIYKCKKCDKNIKAISDVKTLLTTDPIYFDDRAR